MSHITAFSSLLSSAGNSVARPLLSCGETLRVFLGALARCESTGENLGVSLHDSGETCLGFVSSDAKPQQNNKIMIFWVGLGALSCHCVTVVEPILYLNTFHTFGPHLPSEFFLIPPIVGQFRLHCFALLGGGGGWGEVVIIR